MSVRPPSITLRRASEEDLDWIESLLRSEGLSHGDIREDPRRIRVATDHQTVVGIGGLQPADTAALLRSLVVKPAHRGQGYGGAICHQLEAAAADAGVETVYLLTTTAPQFFEGRGYERVERETAPAAIRDTAEFQSLCPADAVCLRRRLPDSS